MYPFCIHLHNQSYIRPFIPSYFLNCIDNLPHDKQAFIESMVKRTRGVISGVMTEEMSKGSNGGVYIVCKHLFRDTRLLLWLLLVGHGGALVESMPFDHRVAGSNSALAAMLGPWASPSLAVACSASECKLWHSVNCCGRKRFWKAHDVRSAIEMDKYNTIQWQHNFDS